MVEWITTVELETMKPQTRSSGLHGLAEKVDWFFSFGICQYEIKLIFKQFCSFSIY